MDDMHTNQASQEHLHIQAGCGCGSFLEAMVPWAVLDSMGPDSDVNINHIVMDIIKKFSSAHDTPPAGVLFYAVRNGKIYNEFSTYATMVEFRQMGIDITVEMLEMLKLKMGREVPDDSVTRDQS